MTAIVSPPTAITLPTPPQPGDDKATFDTRAFAIVAALDPVCDYVDAATGNVYNNATAAEERANAADQSAADALAYRNTASGHATTATTKASEAAGSAIAAADFANDASDSAGAASASASTASGHVTTAQNWAVKTDGPVAGGEYSAKKHAQDAAQSAADAAASTGIPSVGGQSGKLLGNNGTAAAWQTVDKSTLGLDNVDNTSDTSKPVSMAQQAAIDALRDIAATAKATAYTLALTDAGKSIDTTANVTIPANVSVPFPVGTTMMVTNTSASNITISITTDTLRLAGTTTTGTRTLAGYGMCTMRKVAATTWFISGAGLA